MTDPSYRETPEAPPEPEIATAEAEAEYDRWAALPCSERYPSRTTPSVRPLPEWMPTRKKLDEWWTWAWATNSDQRLFVLLRAVRWFMEERENR